MIFTVPKPPQMEHFRLQTASTNTRRNYYKFGIEKTSMLIPKVYLNDDNIGVHYNQTMMQQTAAKHVSTCMENMCLRKGKPCKSDVNINVFEGFTNWM